MSDFSWMLEEVNRQDQVASQDSGGSYDWMLESQPAVSQPAQIDFDQPVDVVRQQVAALPEGQRQQALKDWARVYVAKEREDGGSYVGDTLRNLARGTPVGSWLDEANAFTASIPHSIGLGGPSYDEAMAYQKATDAAIDRDSSKIGELPYVGDVTVGGATKLAGGLASAVASPLIAPFRGASALSTAGNVTATGATYGALYGSGEGESISERGTNAAVGGLAGSVLAPAAVGAGNVVGGMASLGRRALNSARGGGVKIPSIGQGADHRKPHPGAVSRVVRAFTDDGMSNARRYRARAAAAGDEGMLLDQGRNLQMQGGAIANAPGPGQQKIHGALRARERGANARINAAADDALGPRQNVDEAVANRLTETRAAANPFYDEFYKTPLPKTARLESIVERVRSLDQGLDDKIGRMLKADNVDPKLLENGGIIYDYISRRLGDMYDEVSGDNMKRIVSRLRKELQEEVQKIEISAVGKSNWAAAREAAAKGLQFREGTETAGDMFKPGVTFDRFQFQNQGKSAEFGEGVRVGGRDIIRQKMDSATTAFASRDGRAASKGRQLLSPEQTRQKLRFATQNPQAANRLMRRMDAEGIYAETLNDTIGNSLTAARQQAQREFPSALPSGSDTGRSIGYRTWEGASAEAGYRLYNYLSRGALDERRITVARDAAEMLIAKGANRDQIAAYLHAQAQSQQASAEMRQGFTRLAELIARGSTPAAVGRVVENPQSADIAGGLVKGAAMGITRGRAR